MKCGARIWAFSIAGLAVGALPAWSAPLEIVHEPLSCAAAEGYVSVSASVQPASAFATARVEFRAPDGTAWYAVAMTGSADSLTAVLPRPGAGLAAFSYRIVAVDKGHHAATTPAYDVPVVPAASCAVPSATLDRGSAVVVTVPEGAPVVPPVPPGFNPAGAIGSTEAAGDHPSKLGPIAAGAAVLGGLGGLATVFGSHAAEGTGFGGEGPANPNPLGPAQVELLGSDPPPGSTISVSRDRLTMFFRVDSEVVASNPSLTVEVRLQGFVSPFFTTCLRLRTPVQAGRSPLDVAVDGPIEVASNQCTGEYDVNGAVLLLTQASGQVVLGPLDAIPVTYHVVP